MNHNTLRRSKPWGALIGVPVAVGACLYAAREWSVGGKSLPYGSRRYALKR